jgi:hypothetical protein
MNRRILRILPLLLLTLATTGLHAQAKLAIYATGGGEKSGLANQDWKPAATFGLYYGISHITPLSLSIDARGDLSGDIKSGLAGPRLAAKLPGIGIKPYGEILFGVATFTTTAAGLKTSNKFACRYVLGVDATILPHIDWRVADFSYGINESGSGHAKTISSGLVLRF